MTEPSSSPPSLDPERVLWSAGESERSDRPLLVLLHGYGADEHDLFALTPYLPPEFVFAAPRAPLSPPWPAPGYSWYPIDGLDGRSPHATTDAATALIAWLDTLALDTVAAAGAVAAPGAVAAHGAESPSESADPPLVGLLGFSQGAAVAIQALRLCPERFAFVVNLSGYATPGDLPLDGVLASTRPPVFWGRGTRDDVIPAALVAHTTEWLPAHSELSGRVYPGLTHSVSEQELTDVVAFLAKQLEGEGHSAEGPSPAHPEQIASPPDSGIR